MGEWARTLARERAEVDVALLWVLLLQVKAGGDLVALGESLLALELVDESTWQ